MQKIKIVRIERKPTAKGSTMTAIFDDKGTRFSGFAPELEALKEGDLINAEIEVKGKYNNILSAEVLEHGTVETAPKQESDDYNLIKRRSIERQTSLNAAVETMQLVAVKPHPIDFSILCIAEGYYQWLSQGKMPQQIMPIIPALGQEAPVFAETMKDAFKSSIAPVAKPEGNEIPARATEPQRTIINQKIKEGRGLAVKTIMTKYGWSARTAADLNIEQAQKVIDELG